VSARENGGWFCYLLECADGTLYTGIARSLEQRLALHNSGRASKYTRGRLPVRLIYSESHRDRSAASRREYEVKQFSRERKRLLSKDARSGRVGRGRLRAARRL